MATLCFTQNVLVMLDGTDVLHDASGSDHAREMSIVVMYAGIISGVSGGVCNCWFPGLDW